MTPSEIAKKYGRELADVEEAIELGRHSLVRRSRDITVYEKGKGHTLRVTRRGLGPLLVDLDGTLSVKCSACNTVVHAGGFCLRCAAPLPQEATPCWKCGESRKSSADACQRCQTKRGEVDFYHYDFEVNDSWTKYSVIARSPLNERLLPSILPAGPLLFRIDSGCETGQLFGDLTCECRDQLFGALRQVARRGSGLVIHIPRQDGRGIGLPFKLATLQLQRDLGVDTVESGALLEPNASRDTRTFAGAIAILRYLGATDSTPLEVLTNNPKKLEVFKENPFASVTAVPLVIAPTSNTERHLLVPRHVSNDP